MARIFVLAALLVSLCQAQTYQTGQAQIPIAGPLRSTSPSTVPGRKMVSVMDLDGAFVKSSRLGGWQRFNSPTTPKRLYSFRAAVAVVEGARMAF